MTATQTFEPQKIQKLLKTYIWLSYIIFNDQNLRMEQKTKCSLLGEVVSAMSIFSRMQNQHQGKDPEKMFVAFPLENLHLLSASLY